MKKSESKKVHFAVATIEYAGPDQNGRDPKYWIKECLVKGDFSKLIQMPN